MIHQSLLDLGSNIKIHGEIMKRVVIRLYLTKSTEQELEIFVKIKKELESRSFKAQLMQFESKDNYLSMF